MRFRSVAVICFATLWLVSGCSDFDTPADVVTGDSGRDATAMDVQPTDIFDALSDAPEDVRPDSIADDVSTEIPDVHGDASDVASDVADDVSDVQDVTDTLDVAVDTIDPGEPGWPCAGDEECLDGPCVLTDDGRFCTGKCVSGECPEGYTCVPWSVGQDAPALVCMPEFVNVCTPCQGDAECNLGLPGTAGMTCRTLEPEGGRFCLPPCVERCPDGYECTESGLGDGKSWCVPLAGECDCSWLAVDKGARTSCTVGSAGIETRCSGFRTCGLDGLSACSAPRPDGERCNGNDDDCDGATDEAGAIDCTLYYFDLDGDGEGLESVARCYCAANGMYRALTTGDCDDSNPDVNGSAVEQCDQIDNDCDGVTDEPGAQRCRMYFQDLDGDGVGGDFGAMCLCSPSDDFPLTSGGDCDDSSVFVAPDVSEACNGIDDDCDGLTDEGAAWGCQTFYLDVDGDTYGQAASGQCMCAPSGQHTASKVGDCNDQVATINPAAVEICNGLDDNCDLVMDPEGSFGCADWFADRDDDGWGVLFDSRCLCRSGDVYTTKKTGDCDDTMPDVRPDAHEICGNNIDEDCDGSVSEPGALTCQTYLADSDGDGYGTIANQQCLCSPVYPWTVVVGGDCDDSTAAVSPVAIEVCGNAVDDDCDAMTDEAGCSGCSIFYLDVDRDGFGVTGMTDCLSAPDEVSGYVARAGGDCVDSNNRVNPAAVEACNGLDDNCDGLTDPDNSAECTVYYFDFDGDGYGISANSRCLCAPVGDYSAVEGGDCDDNNDRVGGGAESCNGVDDNCNGRVDEEGAIGCLTWYLDDDGDGIGVASSQRCLCAADGRYSTRVAGDCDDGNVSVRPGVVDSCNGVDDNCDGLTDPENASGCQDWYVDGDGDGYGVDGQGRCLCASTGAWVTRLAGDCNDNVKSINPATVEFCNGVDDNCDGQTDSPGSLGCQDFYADRDLDGWGNSNDKACLCAAVFPWTVTVPGDCDDSSASTGPGGKEVCNDLDDDCDGVTDEYGATGCVDYYLDTDRDGFGLNGSGLCSCHSEGLRDATAAGDCDDSNPSLKPGAVEVCNGVDDDCDGTKDPADAQGCVVYMADRDSDGFGVASDTQCLCAPSYPYSALNPGDCDDTRAMTRPGRPESCNGFDDDCDGVTDGPNSTGCKGYYLDADSDGYAVATSMCLCGPSAPYTQTEALGDCDDSNADINAGETEVCDGIDNDCNGTTDDDGTVGCLTRYLDGDGDGWGVAAFQVCRCQVEAPYTATRTGDCNDGEPTVAPNKPEICDGLDNNCDGVKDPANTTGCVSYYIDFDKDGFGVETDYRCLCGPTGSYISTVAGDCNDYNASINPGRQEICRNDIDDNCSGIQDEENSYGCVAYFKDVDTDGFGDPGSTKCLCGPGLEYKVTNGSDCCDKDDRAFPHSTEWQPTISRCNSWDFDCDGRVLKRYNLSGGGCDGWWDGCDLAIGWSGGVPACGVRATYVTGGCGHCGFLGTSCCDEESDQLTQMCN
ncbi:MAG TPA: putative metal-binding motif-containing protein [Myxococcota bacterium]|nr:putative metal-binding motif-containing protein [Myxococcota bacterium]HQP95696.1 putative metal-binding motif-containing protein [Myxococcota bacterium]